jgi:membrane protease YdiL (CAAX protease family)
MVDRGVGESGVEYWRALFLACLGWCLGLLLFRFVSAQGHLSCLGVGLKLVVSLLPSQVFPVGFGLLGLAGALRRYGWRHCLDWARGRAGSRERLLGHLQMLLLCVFVVPLMNYAMALLSEMLGFPVHEQWIVQVARTRPGALFWCVCLVSTTVVAPVMEEILYRLIVYEAVLPLSSRGAACISAFVFAIAHGIWQFIPALFFLGLMLQRARRLGGLRQAMILHSSYNGVSFILIVVSVCFGIGQ